MNIGLVDFDTSHPQNWVPIIRDLGHSVVGVWDGGAVHPPGYADQFAAMHEIPHVFEDLQEMAVRGVLLRRGGLNFLTYSHTATDVAQVVAAQDVFGALRTLLLAPMNHP